MGGAPREGESTHARMHARTHARITKQGSGGKEGKERASCRIGRSWHASSPHGLTTRCVSMSLQHGTAHTAQSHAAPSEPLSNNSVPFEPPPQKTLSFPSPQKPPHPGLGRIIAPVRGLAGQHGHLRLRRLPIRHLAPGHVVQEAVLQMRGRGSNPMQAGQEGSNPRAGLALGTRLGDVRAWRRRPSLPARSLPSRTMTEQHRAKANRPRCSSNSPRRMYMNRAYVK